MFISSSSYCCSPSSSALLRACRVRWFSSSSSAPSSAIFRPSSAPSSLLSRTSSSLPLSRAPASSSAHLRSSHCRHLSFSSAFRSLQPSVPRWSHGAHWRSPLSLAAQIRTAAPVIERFERKLATMGLFPTASSFSGFNLLIIIIVINIILVAITFSFQFFI